MVSLFFSLSLSLFIKYFTVYPQANILVGSLPRKGKEDTLTQPEKWHNKPTVGVFISHITISHTPGQLSWYPLNSVFIFRVNINLEKQTHNLRIISACSPCHCCWINTKLVILDARGGKCEWFQSQGLLSKYTLWLHFWCCLTTVLSVKWIEGIVISILGFHDYVILHFLPYMFCMIQGHPLF